MRRVLSIVIAALLTALGAALAFDRGGWLAWLALVAGAVLLVKAALRPSPRDPWSCGGTALLWTVLWLGTYYYVISNWESGEVVELDIASTDGERTVRVWVVELAGAPTVYYDAEPELADALLSGAPVTLRRGGDVSVVRPRAAAADEVPGETAAAFEAAMERKYAPRTRATTVYYALLGRSRDRIGLLIDLSDCVDAC